MKKTLLVTIDYPPKEGGVARYWKTVSAMMPPEKWTVLSDESALLYKTIWPRWLKGVFSMWRAYRSTGAEQVLVGQLLPVGAMAWVLHLFTHLPYGLQLYGMDIAMANRSPRKRWLARRIVKNAQFVLVNSNATGERARELGVSSFTVVYPVPELEVVPSVVPDKPLILSVGRLVERKGFDIVIKAMPELLKEFPSLGYVLVGDGPDRSRLQQLVDSLGLQKHVVLMGQTTDKLRNTLLASCSFLAMPSRDMGHDVEGFGMVFLEAYAHGKPVIGGRSGGVAEAVRDGKTGLLVQPQSVPDFLQAAKRLLGDKQLAAAYGQGGLDLLKTDFSLEKMREQLMRSL